MTLPLVSNNRGWPRRIHYPGDRHRQVQQRLGQPPGRDGIGTPLPWGTTSSMRRRAVPAARHGGRGAGTCLTASCCGTRRRMRRSAAYRAFLHECCRYPCRHSIEHDSGLCAADRATRARFAQDLRNLTLAFPKVNRRQKSGKDAGEWTPGRNRCWFAGRVLEVKRAYGLTVDRREATALERILRGSRSTAMEPTACRTAPPSAGEGSRSSSGGDDLLAHYDDDGNGRITCKEARRHGIAPVHRTHPAYRYMRDGDEVVCE